MVTPSQALLVLAPTGIPGIDYIITPGGITYWNDAKLGTQPTPAQIAAVTQAQVDAAVLALRHAAGQSELESHHSIGIAIRAVMLAAGLTLAQVEAQLDNASA